jgi:hypothetical protein
MRLDPELIARKLLADLGDDEPSASMIVSLTNSPALTVWHIAKLAEDAKAWRERADRAESALVALMGAAKEYPSDSLDRFYNDEIAPRVAVLASYTRAK